MLDLTWPEIYGLQDRLPDVIGTTDHRNKVQSLLRRKNEL